jgi:hypothetical protein
MLYFQYGPHRSDGDSFVLPSFDFKLYPTKVSNGERGLPKHSVIGDLWGLHSVSDPLSSNVVVSPTCVLYSDTIPFLQVDRERAFECCALIGARDCNPCSKHVITP